MRLEIGRRAPQKQKGRAAIERNEYVGEAVFVHIGEAAHCRVLRHPVEEFSEFELKRRVTVSSPWHRTDPDGLGADLSETQVIRQAVSV